MNCECGGKLIFDHQNDGQYMGGYIYSYKCDKCQMLHFFQTKPSKKKIKKNMKLTGLSFTEQTLVFVLAKLYSIDKEAINEFKDEVPEEIWDFVTRNGE